MIKEKKPKLYIVHCIDTEGPLYESIDATFARLKAIFDIEMQATKANLKKIQRQEVDLGRHTKSISETFSEHLLAYNHTWDKIDLMLDKIMTKEYRDQFQDSDGNGIRYNWHCMDNVGFETNQRRRDLGFGSVFSHYKKKIEEYGAEDNIHWHFHPLSFNKDAHICNTSYDNSYELLHQIICRRLIDHNWFPTVNRAGFHAIRQDSSFFLEQWIPFDYSNQSTCNAKDMHSDSNRFGDWRRASKKWIPYHPSYDDYQLPGNMNRLTTKCLNVGTRFKLLTDEEIELSFQDALDNGSAILAFTNHDFRDMSVDIEDTYNRINKIHENYQNVHTINSDAVTAMKDTFYSYENKESPKIEIDLEIITESGVDKIIATLKQGEVFGSQPYLAIKTNEGRYYHDNFNERNHPTTWEYILDSSTMKLSTIERVVVASNDRYGSQSIVGLQP
jgi:hypothetical protein